MVPHESHSCYWRDWHRRPPGSLSVGGHGRANPPDGAQPRRGSFATTGRGGSGRPTLPGTLDGCLDGIDTVFLVWTAPPSAVVPALERITKRARRIVFLSAPI